MIIKGGPRGKGRELAAHLNKIESNEKVRVFDLRGVFSGSVRGALAEMEGVAAGSKAVRPLYHVSINPEADETLTPEQWHIAADRLEKALGMEGHQRVMVEHLKNGRSHMHVCWCRVDIETMKVAHHSHNYRTHEQVARSLEREFGLNRTQGVHAERDTEKKKPRERPTTHESQMEARTGWKKADAQMAIRAAWERGGDGAAFQRQMEKNGYRLARGDKRDYVVIDPAGGVHSIRSGIRGLRVAEIRDRFADLGAHKLPSVAEAVKAARETYPAFLKDRRHAAQNTRHETRAAPAPVSVRPVRPEPGRYDALRAAALPPPQPSAGKPPFYQVRAKITPGVHNVTWRKPAAQPESPPQPRPTPPPPPQPTPSPPGFAREARADPIPPPRQAATAAPTPAASAALSALMARQAQEWQSTVTRITEMHDKAISALEAHHTQRLATINIEVDARLKELNGLSSRAGALFSPAQRDREIAYLVARRQRSLADEKARQEQVKDDLRRAHTREIEEARGKHDRLAELQRRTHEAKLHNESRLAHRPIQPDVTRPSQDHEREP